MEKRNTPIVGTTTRGVAVATNFKTMLYLLVSIAALFIAIIPAKYVSGMFSENKTAIFDLSLTGSFVFLEFLAWCSLNGVWKIEESRAKKKSRSHQAMQESETETAPLAESEESTAPKPILPKAETDLLPDVRQENKSEQTTEMVEAESPLSSKADSQPSDGEIAETRPDYLQLHQAGCDAYYQRLSDKKKQELSAITEYVNFIMAPFINPDDMETFTNEILSFATDAAYKPTPWKGLKGTLTSFDVRHLIWNITARLGLGKGKPYSTDICAKFILTMFPDICEGLDFSTLRNLRVTSQTDKIHLDELEQDKFDFHLSK